MTLDMELDNNVAQALQAESLRTGEPLNEIALRPLAEQLKTTPQPE